jgi:endonuclease/exonuclease/phosphatase family metal-dependent hydrolase
MSGATSEAVDFTVTTYNVKNPDEEYDWPARAPLVAEVIRRSDPDVIGVQEAHAHQIDDLRRLLPDYEATGQGRDGERMGEHAAVFIRRRRFELLESGSFWLSDEPDTPASNTWGCTFPRVVHHARLRDLLGGQDIMIATTHLDHDDGTRGDVVRTASAELICARFEDAHLPVVLAGDCNTAAGSSAAWNVFIRSGFVDAWDAAADHDDLTNTYNDWAPPTADGERIDWILSKGVSPLRCWMDHHGDVTWRASDHFPVSARFGWS